MCSGCSVRRMRRVRRVGRVRRVRQALCSVLFILFLFDLFVLFAVFALFSFGLFALWCYWLYKLFLSEKKLSTVDQIDTCTHTKGRRARGTIQVHARAKGTGPRGPRGRGEHRGEAEVQEQAGQARAAYQITKAQEMEREIKTRCQKTNESACKTTENQEGDGRF